MKKITLILLVFVLMASACKKDEEEDEAATLNPTAAQKGFGINYTATWCFYCGDWGEARIHKYGADAPNGAIITAHASGDPMHNATLYASLSADRSTGSGIPSFWAGDVSNAGDGAMAGLVAGGSAKAGIDISYSKSGSTMTVKTMTKFFAPEAGDYYLSIWVLEDGIDGSTNSGQYKQKGAQNPDSYKHDYVLRLSATAGNAYGELIASNPADGKTVEKTYTITLDASWKDTYPVAIIWKKEAVGTPSYKYINAIKKK